MLKTLATVLAVALVALGAAACYTLAAQEGPSKYPSGAQGVEVIRGQQHELRLVAGRTYVNALNLVDYDGCPNGSYLVREGFSNGGWRTEDVEWTGLHYVGYNDRDGIATLHGTALRPLVHTETPFYLICRKSDESNAITLENVGSLRITITGDDKLSLNLPHPTHAAEIDVLETQVSEQATVIAISGLQLTATAYPVIQTEIAEDQR